MVYEVEAKPEIVYVVIYLSRNSKDDQVVNSMCVRFESSVCDVVLSMH